METLKELLGQDCYDRLVSAGVDSLKAVVMSDVLGLQEASRMTRAEVERAQAEAALLLLDGKFRPAAEMTEWGRVMTGCESVDACTRGGFPTAGVVELYGCAGVGKTQLCLQMALTVQFSKRVGGLEKGAVYVCTEGVMPTRRLHGLAQSLPPRFAELVSPKYEENIFVEHLADYEQLRRFLFVRLPKLLERVPIGLVVIDSIAGAFRAEYETGDGEYVSRSEEIYTLATRLRELARKFQLAVVCVNQVTQNLETDDMEPCLGRAWANLVTCRFRISRTHDRRRLFEVVNAPDLAPVECHFLIEECGLVSAS